jgi:hypothetical protein
MEASSPMNERTRSRIRGFFALACLVSLVLAVGLQLVGPKLLAPLSPNGAPHYNPPWLVMAAYGFGLLAACTVPLAWRWVYRRGK